MKKIVVVLLVSCSTMVACKQTDTKNAENNSIVLAERNPANETEAGIYASADSMMQAFTNRDWKTFASFTHPAMVRVMGGPENIALLAQQQMEDVPDSIIKSARIEKILQVEKVENELQCLVEQKLVLEMMGKRITSSTYLVGESLNEGKSWTFFDASNEGRIRPLDIKPNLSPKINIPAKKQETTDL